MPTVMLAMSGRLTTKQGKASAFGADHVCLSMLQCLTSRTFVEVYTKAKLTALPKQTFLMQSLADV